MPLGQLTATILLHPSEVEVPAVISSKSVSLSFSPDFPCVPCGILALWEVRTLILSPVSHPRSIPLPHHPIRLMETLTLLRPGMEARGTHEGGIRHSPETPPTVTITKSLFFCFGFFFVVVLFIHFLPAVEFTLWSS